MLAPPPGTRVFLACGVTDMRRGFEVLATLVQGVLAQGPFSGALFCFRGRRGDLVKVLWRDGQGLCLYAERSEKARFVWPQVAGAVVSLTPAQLSMLVEGIDWRMPARIARSQTAIGERELLAAVAARGGTARGIPAWAPRVQAQPRPRSPRCTRRWPNAISF